ncbi:hypothetical protein AURDEDRAFT_181892 [Auricularia subglabra TFB-10046 SS5]|nr:hypothetical protein AURDEDRAFT_181892 [Auricularia subglabra TFB-10046 SS5]
MLAAKCSPELRSMLEQAFESSLYPPLDGDAKRPQTDVAEQQSALYQTLHELLQTVISLHRRCVRRLNGTLPVNMLPPELWLAVFELLPLSDRIRATHVCSQWRAVALSSPSAWVSITQPRRGALLALPQLLLRSQDAPLFLHITSVQSPHDLLLTLDAIKGHMNRVRTLTLGISLFDWSNPNGGHDLFLRATPLLRELNIHWPFARDGCLCILPSEDACFPQLEKVHLINTDAFACFPLFTSLRSLSLTLPPGTTTHRLVTSVSTVPSLEDLQLSLGRHELRLEMLDTETIESSGARPALSSLKILCTKQNRQAEDNVLALLHSFSAREVPLVSYVAHGARLGTGAAPRRIEAQLLADLGDLVHLGPMHLRSRHVEARDARGFARTADFLLRSDLRDLSRLAHLQTLGAQFQEWMALRGAGVQFGVLQRLTIEGMEGEEWPRDARWPACPALRVLTLTVREGNTDVVVSEALDFVQYYIGACPRPLEHLRLAGLRPQRLLWATKTLPQTRRALVSSWEFVQGDRGSDGFSSIVYTG